jgi:purine-binding chemotaxis protein CheW
MQATDVKTAAANSAARQVLTFQLGAESYGIDILQIQEIRGWAPVTKIPQSPRHVLGVLILRGSIVTIIEMRLRFGLPSAEFTALTVIIVISMSTPTGMRECGLVVDSVSDVVDLADAAIRPAPDLSGNSSDGFIESLATLEDKMLILLNVRDLLMADLQQMHSRRDAAAA